MVLKRSDLNCPASRFRRRNYGPGVVVVVVVVDVVVVVGVVVTGAVVVGAVVVVVVGRLLYLSGIFATATAAVMYTGSPVATKLGK